MFYQEDFHYSSHMINTPRISVDDTTDSSGSLAATHRYDENSTVWSTSISRSCYVFSYFIKNQLVVSKAPYLLVGRL